MRRRDLAWMLVAAPVTAQPPPQATTAAQDLEAARARVKGNVADLAKVKMPIATEPAFAFKA